jgi:hypothetical protein
MFRPRRNAESKNGVRVPHPALSGQQRERRTLPASAMAAASSCPAPRSRGRTAREAAAATAHIPKSSYVAARWRETQPACRRPVLVLPGHVRGRTGEGMRAHPTSRSSVRHRRPSMPPATNSPPAGTRRPLACRCSPGEHVQPAGSPPGPADVPHSAPDMSDLSSLNIEFPVLVKAAGGGGGRGLRVVREPGGLADAVAVASAEADAAFGLDAVLVGWFPSSRCPHWRRRARRCGREPRYSAPPKHRSSRRPAGRRWARRERSRP